MDYPYVHWSILHSNPYVPGQLSILHCRVFDLRGSHGEIIKLFKIL